MKTEYPAAPVELDVDSLPQTDFIAKKPNMVFNDHKWIQQGNTIIEQCHHGIAMQIPFGKMLIKDKEGYQLIDEVR